MPVIANSLLHHFADPVELCALHANGQTARSVMLIDLLRPPITKARSVGSSAERTFSPAAAGFYSVASRRLYCR